MGSFIEALKNNNAYLQRKEKSEKLIDTIKTNITKDNFLKALNDTAIYAVGSLGRFEFGDKSDLDIFSISKKRKSRLFEINFFASLVNINNSLELPEFSNQGKFLKIFDFEENQRTIGLSTDDHENWFTARMLLILESKPLNCHDLYDEFVRETIKLYFRDEDGHERDFKPIFLINDLLRFWRTLCINYEKIRYDKTIPWRKKNINLKFGRRLTVFATILWIVAQKSVTVDDFVNLVKLTPIERLATALDIINDADFLSEFNIIIDSYFEYINIKEQHDNPGDKIIDDLNSKAVSFRKFIVKIANHTNIEVDFIDYLIS